MSILLGDTGRASVGNLKTINFQHQFIEQDYTGITLPTSLPPVAQLSYVIGESNLPIISGGTTSFLPMPWTILGGQNTSGVSVTIYYEIYRNGVLWQSGNRTSVPNGQYWTFFCLKAENNMVVGEEISVKVWTTATGVSILYSCYSTFIGRLDLGLKFGAMIKDVSATVVYPHTVINGYNAMTKWSSWTGSLTIFPMNNSGFASTSANAFIPLLQYCNTTYRLFSNQGGDANNATGINYHTSQFPNVQQTAILTSISFRELNL